MTVRKRTIELDWEDVRYFVALTRHGSLSATARRLRVTHATVARRLASLETKLGHVLFERRASGYILTSEGKAVLDEANAMEEAALSVLRRLDTSTELNGLVRFTAARALAEGFIISRLGEFHRRYPALNLELIGDARVISLAKREADIALRLGGSKDSDLIARRVGKISFGFYASADYRERLASEEPTFIGYDEDSDFIFEASWLTRQFANKRFTFRTNSQTSQAAAARAGYGIALLPKYLAANDPDLVRISLEDSIPDRDVWLLTRHELKSVPRIRAVADYFVEMFHRERHILGDE